MGKIDDLSGRRFGRLVVLTPHHERSADRGLRWVCRCDCGREHITPGASLKAGNSTSCGCYLAEILAGNTNAMTHGDARRKSTTAEYGTWRAMRRRCNDPNDKDFANYGGRGISVCPQWDASFEQFLADMGRKPDQWHTIDRYPNNDGNYEPGNCRWATATE